MLLLHWGSSRNNFWFRGFIFREMFWKSESIICYFNLKFNVHVRKLEKYLSNLVRQLWHLNLYCSPSLIKTIYNCLIKSKIEYGSTVWGGTYFNITNDLLVKQKKAVRIICICSRPAPIASSATPLFLLYFEIILQEVGFSSV